MSKEDKTTLGIIGISFLMALFAAAMCILNTGCSSYRGGKIVDGTNLAIGMTIPGTQWTINVADYIAGLRVAGNDATAITVTHEVAETNSYFGVIKMERRSYLTTTIEPTLLEIANADTKNNDECNAIGNGECQP